MVENSIEIEISYFSNIKCQVDSVDIFNLVNRFQSFL